MNKLSGARGRRQHGAVLMVSDQLSIHRNRDGSLLSIDAKKDGTLVLYQDRSNDNGFSASSVTLGLW